jgi:hypothetical protein
VWHVRRTVEARWHPKKRVIAGIWIVVFGVAFGAAAIFQDNDPNTDEGAGFGALAFIVGTLGTVVYLVAGRLRHSRSGAKNPEAHRSDSKDPDS